MATQSIRNPFPIFEDIDGTLLQNGYIYAGSPNTNPETNPVAVFWDSALTQAASQPLKTLNGVIVRSGSPANVYTAGDFSLTVRNKQGYVIYSVQSYATAGVISGFAAAGANSDITSLSGLTTPLSAAQGGTQIFSCGTATGSANALIFALVTPATGFTLTAGVRVTGIIASDNTAATTMNAASSGDIAVQITDLTGLVACAGGELQAGMVAEFEYTGSVWELLNPYILGTNLIFTKNVALNGSVSIKEQTLVVTTAIAAWDMTKGPNALVNLTIATTQLANPTNQAIGDQGIIRFLEDGTGGRLLTFDTSYKIVTDAFWSGANYETEYFYKVVAAPGANSVELRAKTPRRVVVPALPTTSGTSVDFTNIPSWVNEIEVEFAGVSTNGTSNLLVQIGNGTVEVTTYISVSTRFATTTNTGNVTVGFVVFTVAATDNKTGRMSLRNPSGNIWVEDHLISSGATFDIFNGTGIKTIGAILSILRLTTVNGTDVFDAGSIGLILKG